jgi:hypothetical protein
VHKEIKDVPVDKSLAQIVSFAGVFSDMSSKDYSAFVHQTKMTRKKLFDRKSPGRNNNT